MTAALLYYSGSPKNPCQFNPDDLKNGSKKPILFELKSFGTYATIINTVLGADFFRRSTAPPVKHSRKEAIGMFESISSFVNIAFYVLAAIVIIGAIIKIVKSKKDKTNSDEEK